MPEYDNTNSGALFVNDRKERENQPDRNGSINVDGVDYWISGWLKQGKKGQYLSLAVTKKEQQGGAPQSGADDEALNEDIPF